MGSRSMSETDLLTVLVSETLIYRFFLCDITGSF